MNTKRILSIFIIFTLLMLCCGAAFASDAIDSSNHDGYIIDESNLDDSGLDDELDDDYSDDDELDDSDDDWDDDYSDDDELDDSDDDWDDDYSDDDWDDDYSDDDELDDSDDDELDDSDDDWDDDYSDDDWDDDYSDDDELDDSDDDELDDSDDDWDDDYSDDDELDDSDDDYGDNEHYSVVKNPILVWYNATGSKMSLKYASKDMANAASNGLSYSDYKKGNTPKQLVKHSILPGDSVTSSIGNVKDISRDVVDVVINEFSEGSVVKTAEHMSGGAKYASAKTLPATGNPLAILGLALCGLVIYYRKR